MKRGVAILVPMKGRAHRVAPLLESVHRATPRPWRVMFIPDPGDDEVIGAVTPYLSSVVTMLVLAGNYATKINAAVRATSEPLLFFGADDLEFHPGWLAAAKRLLSDEVGVVGTNDLCSRRVMAGEHATHPLVARWYTELGTVDDTTKVLHDGYPHEWVDDEFIGTAKHREAFASAPDSIVEHLHPMVGKAPMDDLYAAQRNRMRAGRKLFKQRRRLWTAPSS